MYTYMYYMYTYIIFSVFSRLFDYGNKNNLLLLLLPV